MRTLGIIGGMSWESTLTYYRGINQSVNARLGGLHSAQLLLHSVDFAVIEQWQHSGQWQQCGELLADAAHCLVGAGAEGIVLATNTMHVVAQQIEQRINVPFIHLAEVTAQALVANDINKVGLLGTRFTMEQPFYIEKLQARGIEVFVPNQPQRERVHEIIYQELCQGQINPQSRAEYVRIIDDLAQQGAQGVILGCTEIGLLIEPQHTALRCFDTTALHIAAATDFMLS